MSVIWLAAELWPVRIAVIGGALLLAGRLLMAFTEQPARRVVVGTLAIILALAVIPLSLLPGWVPLNVPAAAPEQVVAAARTVESPAETLAEEVLSPPAGDWAFFIVPAPTESAGPAPIAAPEPAALETPVTAAAAAPVAAASPAELIVDRWRAAFAVYDIVAGLLLARLAIGQLGLSRLWRAACPAPTWAEHAFRKLADPVCPWARLRISHRATGPVCFGVWRPRVLVPATALADRDGPAFRSILTHELGHLRRGDPLVGWLLGLVRAVYFFWPWLSGLRRELRLAQEHLADADAARAAGPAEYAELLIRMTRARPAPLGAAGVRGPSSELYRRVTMVLRTSGRVEGRCPRRWALATGAALTALAVAAAGLYVQPRPAIAAEPEKKDAEKPAPNPDLLKDALDKLKKDLGDNPEAVKQLDELLRGFKDGKRATPAPGVAVPPPLPVPPPAPALRGAPIQPGRIDRPDVDREIEQAREMMRRYMEQMQAQLRAGGLQGGAFVGPPGALRPFGLTGGGRLGVRVEKPSDVLASQLELPNGQGLVCVDVPADSPAGKAGIKPNDILLEVAGKAVPSDRDEFVKALKEVKPDAPVDVVVLRKGKKETLKGAKFPEAKEPEFPGFPGAGLRDFQGPGVIVAPVPFPAFGPPPLPSVGKNTGVTVGPGETVRVEQVNDAFTVFYSKNGVKVTISGSKDADGQAKAESIEVEADGKTTKAESIDKLPKEYQDLATTALKSIK